MNLDEIFEQLREAASAGAALPTPLCPEIEEDLKPFILRPMTDDELALMSARDAAGIEAQKMIARVLLLQQLGLLDDATPQEIKRDEEQKFTATMLADLFFWSLQAATGWQFASIYQRFHEKRVVLVGLKTKEAREFLKKQREARQMSELIGEKMGPRMVN
jgi:hypothetical protein